MSAGRFEFNAKCSGVLGIELGASLGWRGPPTWTPNAEQSGQSCVFGRVIVDCIADRGLRLTPEEVSQLPPWRSR
eukprot:15434655-Alexandrium_andersonii.AAC.1